MIGLTFMGSDNRQTAGQTEQEQRFKKGGSGTFILKMLQIKTKEVNCLKSYNRFTPQLNLELGS